jgi:hypothetical protein
MPPYSCDACAASHAHNLVHGMADLWYGSRAYTLVGQYVECAQSWGEGQSVWHRVASACAS